MTACPQCNTVTLTSWYLFEDIEQFLIERKFRQFVHGFGRSLQLKLVEAATEL